MFTSASRFVYYYLHQVENNRSTRENIMNTIQITVADKLHVASRDRLLARLAEIEEMLVKGDGK